MEQDCGLDLGTPYLPHLLFGQPEQPSAVAVAPVQPVNKQCHQLTRGAVFGDVSIIPCRRVVNQNESRRTGSC